MALGCLSSNADVIPILENRLERLGTFKEYVFEREKLAGEAEARSFSLPSVDATDKLLRYEAHFDRQLYRAMDELERLQRRRKGENLPPPLNVNLGRRSVGLFCETKPRGCLISVAGRLIFMGQSQTRPGDGKRKMLYARRFQYRTAQPRRAGAVAACARKGLRCRGPSGAKACARAADPKSRALETDASRLNGRRHGAWGSSAVLSAVEGSLRPESSVLTDSDRRDMA